MLPAGMELGLIVLTAKLMPWLRVTNAASFDGDRFLMRGGSLVAPMASAQFTAAKKRSYALVLYTLRAVLALKKKATRRLGTVVVLSTRRSSISYAQMARRPRST